MTDPISTLAVGALALLSLAATALGFRRMRVADTGGIAPAAVLAAITLGGAAVFAYRWGWVTRSWQPLAAHVDGLLLVATILGAVLTYLTLRPGWIGLVAFATPAVTLVLAWAFCAATWTYRPFALDTLEPLWRGLHLTGVYAGTAVAALAAAAAALYLHVQHRLKHKRDVPGLGRLSSLESLERVVQQTATLGFVLLTVGLVTGLVIAVENPDHTRGLGAVWWRSPKVLLATVAWVIYALLMNLRYATGFRGTRAAVLAIAGFVLLLGTYGVVTAMPPTLDVSDPDLDNPTLDDPTTAPPPTPPVAAPLNPGGA